MSEPTKADAPAAASKGSGLNIKLILLIVILLIVFAGLGGGVTYFLLTKGYLGDFGHAAPHEPPPPPPLVYHPLDPLSVNLPSGPAKILRVAITFTTRDPAVIAALQRHLPRILNTMLTYLGAQDYATLNSAEGKDRLRGEILLRVVKLLEEVREPTDIEGILFTDLVMQ